MGRGFEALVALTHPSQICDRTSYSPVSVHTYRLETLERNLRRAHGPIFDDEIARDLPQILDETLGTVRNASVHEEGMQMATYSHIETIHKHSFFPF